MTNKSPGKLYLIGTPIGNLGDITYRAVEILKSLKIIFCEDISKAKILFSHYNIKPEKIYRLNTATEHKASLKALAILKEGNTLGYISEAGMPLISDPGYELVKLAISNNIPVEVIPGPSASLTALILSAFPIHTFSFLGYLPPKGSKRKEKLQFISNTNLTTIIYESPHRLIKTLRDIANFCGENRKVFIGNELTKLYEKHYRGTSKEILKTMEKENIKGEYTIVIEGIKNK